LRKRLARPCIADRAEKGVWRVNHA